MMVPKTGLTVVLQINLIYWVGQGKVRKVDSAIHSDSDSFNNRKNA